MKLFCAIARDSGAAFPVKIDSDEYVGDLKIAIKKDNEDIKVPARALRLFLARKDKGEGDWLKSEDLLRMRKGETLGDDESCYMEKELDNPVKRISTVIPSIPDEMVHVLVEVPMGDLEREWEELLRSLAWKDTKKLCSSPGSKWEYQGKPELVETLAKPLVDHYNAGKRGDEERHSSNRFIT